MRELPINFDGKGEVSGVSFRQIQMCDKAYVYLRTDGYYEVFERRENSQWNVISYPKSEAFGVWAWCFKTEGKAMKKFDELCV